MGGFYRKVDIRDSKSHNSPPKALQLLKVGEDGKPRVNENVLSMLQNEGLKDNKVCIVSVAGAMRQGKSFLLNFFLHFLNKKSQNTENWIGREGNLQTGFFWETRAERVTEGIHIWSEIFLTKVDNEDIAVILMDTQGTFDNDLDMTQVSTLFALSVLLSSVQIYNIKDHIALNVLQDLQLFTGYASLQEECDKPFQKLLILVRDWCYPYDHPFGEEGGKRLLEKVFEKQEKSNQKEIQETIRENFDEVGAFLLPFPGENVIMDTKFTGRFKDISPTFLDNVEKLVPSLLAPERLIPKKINEELISFSDFSTFLTIYLKHVQSETKPEVKTMFKATCEAACSRLIDRLKKRYRQLMDTCESFEEAESIMEKILHEFQTKKKMGNDSKLFKTMEDQLRKDLEEIFNSSYKKKLTRKEMWRKIKSLLTFGGISSAVGGAVRLSTLVPTVAAGMEGASAWAVTQATTAAAFTTPAVIGGVLAGAGVGLVVGGFALVGVLGWKYFKPKKTSTEEKNGEPATSKEGTKNEKKEGLAASKEETKNGEEEQVVTEKSE